MPTGVLLIRCYRPFMDSSRSLKTVFYDGTCGFCHGAVQFLLRRDPLGKRFRYAPLQGNTASKTLAHLDGIPDSMVVQCANGDTHTEAKAALTIARSLGGAWSMLATIARILPWFVLNGCYRLIAKNRYRMFGRKRELCPLLPPEQRELFLP